MEKPQTHKLALPFNGTDGGRSGPLSKGVLTITPGDKLRISAAKLQLGLLAQVPIPAQVSQVCMWCVCVCPWHVSGGQRTTFGSWFSPPPMRVLGIELRMSSLAVGAFTH